MSADLEESPFARALEAALKERAALEAAGELVVDTWQGEPVSAMPKPRRTLVSPLRRRMQSAWSRVRSLWSTGRAGRSGRRLQVVETAALGEKRFVAILAVEQREFLIGGGPAGIALLADLQVEPARDGQPGQAKTLAPEVAPARIESPVQVAAARTDEPRAPQATIDPLGRALADARTVPGPSAVSGPEPAAKAAVASKSAALHAPQSAPPPKPRRVAPKTHAASRRAPQSKVTRRPKPAAQQDAQRAAKPAPPVKRPIKKTPAPTPASSYADAQLAKTATGSSLPSASTRETKKMPARRTADASGAKRTIETAQQVKLPTRRVEGAAAELALAPVARRRKTSIPVPSPAVIPLPEASPLFEEAR